MLDTAIWWTGVAVLATGAFAFAVALVASAAAIATVLADRYARRFGNIYHNLTDLARWVDAGRPKWKEVNGVYRMVPSHGEWSDDEEPRP